MLTVMRALTWPKLIGGAVGVIGLGSIMSAVGAYLPLSLFTDAFPVGPEGWFAVLASVMCLVLSYPLYRGCDWARRALFVISLFICVGFTIVFLSSVFRRPKIAYDGDASRITAEQIADFRRQELFVRLTRAGNSLWPLTLAGFLTVALLHPDVVQAFRRRATPDDHQNI
jgi:hypothetical protein